MPLATNIEVDAASFGTATAAIDRMTMAAASLNMTALPAIAGDFHRQMAKVFDKQGSAEGAWEPLSPTTLKIRQKRGSESDKILIDHGTLAGSLTRSDAEGSVMRIEGDEMFVGTDLPYAQYHQTGPRQISVFGRGTARLPERKMVSVGEEDVARWAGIVMAGMRPGTKYGMAEMSEVQFEPDLDAL